MSAPNPLTRLPKAIFRGIPSPLLFLVSLGLLGILGFDLVLPDFVPFLDEAIFALLLYGSVSTLLDRRAGRLGATGPASEALPVGKMSKALTADVKLLADRAAALRKEGFPLAALDGLASLPADATALVDDLKRIDGFLSRKENDPWQVGREVEKLERNVANAEAEGATGRMQTLQVALEGARMHLAEIQDKAAARDAAAARIQAMSAQVNTLSETLRVVADRGGVPELPASLGKDWEPQFAAVIDGLREVHVAAAELDEAVGDRAPEAAARRPRVKA